MITVQCSTERERADVLEAFESRDIGTFTMYVDGSLTDESRNGVRRTVSA